MVLNALALPFGLVPVAFIHLLATFLISNALSMTFIIQPVTLIELLLTKIVHSAEPALFTKLPLARVPSPIKELPRPVTMFESFLPITLIHNRAFSVIQDTIAMLLHGLEHSNIFVAICI